MEHALVTAADFFRTVVREDFLAAIGMTVFLSLVSGFFAILAGFLSAFMGMSAIRPLRWLSSVYIELFRNTPLLIQLYIYYKGLQSIGIILDPVICGILGLSLYTGAYLSEVFRSGLLSVPANQLDAGLAMGLSRFEAYGLILIPQAFRVILPPLCNQMINLTKNSSLVAFITVEDIFYMVYKGAVDEFQPMKYFVIGAMLYVTLTLTIAAVTQLLDWLIDRRILRFPAIASVQEVAA